MCHFQETNILMQTVFLHDNKKKVLPLRNLDTSPSSQHCDTKQTCELKEQTVTHAMT